MSEERKGMFLAIGAYLVWGVLPIYWKTLDHVPSIEILMSRIVWAFLFTLVIVLIMKKGRTLQADFIALWKNPKAFWSLFFASFLITINWFLYIWAVNSDHLIQTSLGYYINPLVSVLLGIIFLKESLSKAEKLAFVIATIGVTILTISYGEFPWLAFALAISFALYGLMKKTIKLDALRGLTIETMFIVPFALLFYFYLFATNKAILFNHSIQTDILFVLTGAATAIPLLLFTKGAQKIPLYMIGFLQYLAPTSMLFLGVVIYGETFKPIDLISFSFIWIALLLFTFSKVMEARIKKRKIIQISN